MHNEQAVFVQTLKNTYPHYFNNCSILEVGSCNINGTIRDYFENCEYVGIDVGPGNCVDIVCSGHEYDGPSNYFNTVISTECFEHNPFWLETFTNMIRMCKSGGLIAFTCAGEIRPEHGTFRSNPDASHLTNSIGWGDYYRNLSASDFTSKIDFNKHFAPNEYTFVDGYSYEYRLYRRPMDLYFWGFKK